jgi:shikimate 5-dehydrogenase
MVIIDPKDFERIMEILQKNEKYIWWWLGVWFKDFWRNMIKNKSYWFVHPVAEEMQSINFIAHFGEEIHGYNSDASWYTDSLCDKFKEIGSDIQNKNIVLLWAWWTARWIALELTNRWINNITILNRTLEKAEYIANHLNNIKKNIAKAGKEDDIYNIKNEKIDAIINISTKGADGDFEKYSGLLSTEWWIKRNIEETKNILQELKEYNPELIISDINLTKNKTTPLLEIAKSLELSTLDGQFMVIYQWIQAIWTVFGDKIIKQWWNKEEIKQFLINLIFKEKN